MNSKNSKTSDPHRPLLNLSHKINLKGSVKYNTLLNLNIYYSWKDIKMSYKNNKFKVSVPPWNYWFKLPNASYSVSIFKIILCMSSKNMKQ